MIHQTWSWPTIEVGIDKPPVASGHWLTSMRAHGSDWWIECSGEYINGVPHEYDLDEYLETLTPVPYLGPPVFDEKHMEIAPPSSGGVGMLPPRDTGGILVTDAKLRANVRDAMKRR